MVFKKSSVNRYWPNGLSVFNLIFKDFQRNFKKRKEKNKIKENERKFSMTGCMMASQSSVRFLGILKPPDSDHLEIDEGDLFWSSSSDSSPYATSPSPPTHLNRSRNHFKTSISGLSAALNDDHHLVRRKSTLNPSVSAARVIPQVNSNSNPNGMAKFHQSAPVNVPAWPKHKKGGFDAFDEFDEMEYQLDEDEMVPPHVIVAKAHVTLSVFEGVGRTLKGRDLRRVRNAVFQQTGFLD